jgi:hypothetical protein
VAVGVAVAVAIVVYLRGRDLDRTHRLRSAAIGFVMAAIAGGLVLYVVQMVRPEDEDAEVLDQAVANAHSLPMVGVVLDDVPGSQQRLREALKEEMHRPTTEGVSRPLKLMRELRTEYVVPALRAADEPSAAAAIQARSALLKHLQATDLPICKEFALTGIQQTDRLDATGQKLLRDVLTALERAYRTGRSVKTTDSAPPRVVSDAEAHALLAEAGFSDDDFGKLSRLSRLSEQDACAIALRFNEAPWKVAVEKRGPMMRYLLTVQ